MSLDIGFAVKTSLAYAGCCFGLHVLLYAIFNSRLKEFSKGNKMSFYNRGVSTVHAFVMFFLSLYYWLVLNPKMIIHDMDAYQTYCLLLMMGYLVYDTMFELSASRQAMTIAHHVLGAASHISTLTSYNGAAAFYSMIIFLAEGSTPLLNASWLLQKLNMLKTSMFKLCAVSLILSFFVLRVVLSPFMLGHMHLFKDSWGPNNDALYWFNFAIVGSFMLLNYFWFYKLVALALKK